MVSVQTQPTSWITTTTMIITRIQRNRFRFVVFGLSFHVYVEVKCNGSDQELTSKFISTFKCMPHFYHMFGSTKHWTYTFCSLYLCSVITTRNYFVNVLSRTKKLILLWNNLTRKLVGQNFILNYNIIKCKSWTFE